MAAFRGKKKDAAEEATQLPAQFGISVCGGCRRPLQLEMVLSAEAELSDGGATGFVMFQHFCPCQPSAVHVSRVWGSYPSFLALFGVQPTLPYTAPFAWQAVGEDDPTLSRWRWELGQVADVGEFLLFLDDAADRRAA